MGGWIRLLWACHGLMGAPVYAERSSGDGVGLQALGVGLK